jgi:hypothetical protein
MWYILYVSSVHTVLSGLQDRDGVWFFFLLRYGEKLSC